MAAQSLFCSDKFDREKWVFDTAASHHFCKDRKMFSEFEELENEHVFIAIEGVSFEIEGKGTVKLKINGKNFTLTNVLYSPKLKRNLISGSRFCEAGFRFVGQNGKISVFKDKLFVFTAYLKKGIYYVKAQADSCSDTRVCSSDTQMEEWHRKFAHASVDAIDRTSKSESVFSLPKLNSQKFSCDTCRLAKQKNVNFKPVKYARTKRPLELLYMETWGPSNVKGLRGENFYLSIVDDFSRKITLYPLFDRADAFKIFREHVKRAERQLSLKLKSIRTDTGNEFKNSQFRNYCQETGVKHEFKRKYTPWHNGVSERLNQEILNGVRALLFDGDLEKKFWPEAMLYFAHAWNRLCHKDQNKTPIELYHGKPPSAKHLKPFGTRVYISSQNRSKSNYRSEPGILVGYALKSRGYRIWLPEKGRIIETSDLSLTEEKCQDSGAVLEPEVEMESMKEDEGSPDVKPEDSSSEEDEASSANTEPKEPIWLRKPLWIREVKTKKDGTSNKVYYCEMGSNFRLKSLNEVRKYCLENDLKFDEKIFSYDGADLTQGVVNDDQFTDEDEF